MRTFLKFCAWTNLGWVLYTLIALVGGFATPANLYVAPLNLIVGMGLFIYLSRTVDNARR